VSKLSFFVPSLKIGVVPGSAYGGQIMPTNTQTFISRYSSTEPVIKSALKFLIFETHSQPFRAKLEVSISNPYTENKFSFSF
jgi:hypothetical protein